MGRDEERRLEEARQRIAGWVDVYAETLYGVALGTLRHEQDAADAVQETWRILLEQWDRLPEDDFAQAWMIGILMNVIRARRRVESNRERLRGERRISEPPPAPAQQPPVEANLLASQVYDAILGLPRTPERGRAGAHLRGDVNQRGRSRN